MNYPSVQVGNLSLANAPPQVWYPALVAALATPVAPVAPMDFVASVVNPVAPLDSVAPVAKSKYKFKFKFKFKTKFKWKKWPPRLEIQWHTKLNRTDWTELSWKMIVEFTQNI